MSYNKKKEKLMLIMKIVLQLGNALVFTYMRTVKGT